MAEQEFSRDGRICVVLTWEPPDEESEQNDGEWLDLESYFSEKVERQAPLPFVEGVK